MASRRLQVERLGRFFSPTVAQAILERKADDRGSLGTVTVLVSDVRGFTELSSKLGPTEVVALLSELHARMVEVVFAHGGTLDEFTGDGMLAYGRVQEQVDRFAAHAAAAVTVAVVVAVADRVVPGVGAHVAELFLGRPYFGAPLCQPDQAARGVACAIDMLEALAVWNAQRDLAGEAPIAMGIGLCSGQEVVGTVGPPQRQEHTVIGDTVNVASRVESLTKELGVPCLAHASTQAAAADRFAWVACEPRAVRGKPEPLQTFAPSRRAG